MLRLGETFIYGLTREQAREILTVAEELGVDRNEVRTTDSGFVVPNAIAEELEMRHASHWAPEGAVF